MYKPKKFNFPTKSVLIKKILKAKNVYITFSYLNCPVSINKEQLATNFRFAAWIDNEDQVSIEVSEESNGDIYLKQYLK